MRTKQMEWDDPHLIFSLIFAGGSLGGLASLLRSHKVITWRNLVSAMLNSGIITTIIALVWWTQYAETNMYFLVGVSLLAGLGGATTFDLIMVYIRTKFLKTDATTDVE